MRSRVLFCITLLILCTSACVTSGDGDKMKQDIAQLQAETQQLAERAKTAEDQLSRSQTEIEDLEKLLEDARRLLSGNNADLLAQVLEVRNGMGKIQGDHDLIKRKLEGLDKDYELFKNDVAERLSGSNAKLPTDAEGLFALAEQLRSSGDQAGAGRAYEAFARNFAKDPRAAQARFMVGETYLAQGQVLEAFEEYRVVLKSFPKSDYIDDATYRVGDVFVARGECSKAEVFYSEVVDKFKRSPYRKEAKNKLKEIKKGRLCKK